MALVIGTNCGFVTAAPTTDPLGQGNSNLSGYSLGIKCTSPATATKVTEIGFWVDGMAEGDNTNGEVAIYSHDSENNKPDEIIGVVRTNDIDSTGWQNISTDITISGSTTYWICVQVDTAEHNMTGNYQGIAGEYEVDSSWPQTTLVTPWNDDGDTYLGYTYGVYAVWEAAAAADTVTQINIGDTWKEIEGMKINIGDVWKTVEGLQVNIGDDWKTVF